MDLYNRRLTARLPDEKYKDWSIDIINTTEKRRVRGKEIEYLEGQLNHANFIFLLGQQFLDRIRKTKYQSIKIGHPMKTNS